MTSQSATALDSDLCRRACLARDARFDGLFFTAVRTTGIFCRPICPVAPPKAVNVSYFATALAATRAGFRPCLRCRPEAAPDSPAWRGVKTTLGRAVRLIDSGDWRDQSLPAFAARLGVGDRYLRRLFQTHLGVSPLGYANFRRALFAKRLLQDTALPVSAVATMAGFGSVRRCHAACVKSLGMNPRAVRRARDPGDTRGLTLALSYRPPYAWTALRDFLAARCIPGLEAVTATSYGRSFAIAGARGMFVATHTPAQSRFSVRLWLDRPETTLAAVEHIRRVLDLDAEPAAITTVLHSHPALAAVHTPGLRLPGVWTPFEAGARAILGQQVSVAAARRLVGKLVDTLGEACPPSAIDTGAPAAITRLFPEPAVVRDADLDFLPMPGKRRDTLRALARHIAAGQGDDPESWQGIPGVGPWTRDYAALRLGDPDIFLADDLGVRRALARLSDQDVAPLLAAELLRPWRSYATLQLWLAPSPQTSAISTGPVLRAEERTPE